jgi:hypothetical protein
VQPIAQRKGAMLRVSPITGALTDGTGQNKGGVMDLLSREERRSIHARFAQMPNPVHLLIFTRRESGRGAAARQLGLELRSLSRNVHLELHDVDANPQLAARYGIGLTPAIALLTGGVVIEDTHIRFQGLPEGTVQGALVDAMVAVGHGDSVVTAAAGRLVPQLDDALEATSWGEPEPLDTTVLARELATRAPAVNGTADLALTQH